MQYKLRTFSRPLPENISIEEYLYFLLEERGIDDPRGWLNVDKSNEHDPSLLVNIDKAAELLNEELTKEFPRIYLQVDSDTDGYTSSAMMYYFIKQVNPDSIIDFNLHPGKEHEINMTAVSESSANLIIVPDAGTNDFRQQDEIIAKGKKYIIIDHHEPESGINFEDRLIVNNQVGYPNPHLSGAGVSLKFCQYYAKKYNTPIDEDMLYALAAVGIVADVMSIKELENKYIIDRGLSTIGVHSYLRELLVDKKGNYIEKPTIKDIGWTIGPNINAVIRLGSMEEKIFLFNTMVEPNRNVISNKRGDTDVVVPIWKEMLRLSTNIKSKQTRLVKKGMDEIKNSIDRGKTPIKDNILVYVDEDRVLPFEMSGLIANKLLSEYKIPVLLLKNFEDLRNKKAPKEWRGSVRGAPAAECENLKEKLSGLTGVSFAQGHAFAFGIGIEQKSFDAFLAHASEVFSKIDFNNQLYVVDEILSVKTFDTQLGAMFANEEVWGQGVEKPLVVLEDINCLTSEFMGADSKHVKITDPKVNIVIFDDEELVETLKHSKNQKMRAVGQFSWDTYGGVDNPKLQFVVEDYELEEDYSNVTDWSDF